MGAAPAASSDTPQAEVATSSGVDNAEGNDLEGGKPCEGNIAPAVQSMDGRQACVHPLAGRLCSCFQCLSALSL